MTVLLADEQIDLRNLMEVCKALRDEGMEYRDSSSPDAEAVTLWRRRVGELVNMKDPRDPRKDLVNSQIQTALLKLEDEILIHHPHLS